MKRLSFLIALMVFLNWSGPARAEPDISALCVSEYVDLRGMTYNFFRGMSEQQRINYITSWLQGALTGLSMTRLNCSKIVSSCINSTSQNQRLSILENEAKDSPEQ